jgi:HEAT repeat protein
MNERTTVAMTPAEQSRVAAVSELARGGPGRIPDLIAMLDDPSWAVRRHVIAALAGAGDAAVEHLCEVVRARREHEARIAAAVDALAASIGDPREGLGRLARDRTAAVRADAAQVLGRRRDPGAVALLSELAQDPDDNVAVSAVEGLGRVGGRAAIEALLGAARSQSFFRVFPAIDVLGRTDDPRAIPALAGLLQEPLYAFEAARALGRSGEATAVAPLGSLLSSPTAALVRTAAVALVELHGRAAERYGTAHAVEDALRKVACGEPPRQRLARALQEAHRDEQKAIAFVLGIVGGDIAIAALEGLLDAADGVGEAAALALRRLGPGSEAAIRLALREGNAARRRAVLPAVTRASSAPEVMLCLADPDPEVRSLAADALARVGATHAVAALFPLLSDRNPRVVQTVTGAIQALGTSETKPLALAAAASPDPAVKRSALRILAYFGYGEALPHFLEAIRSPDVRLREVALAGLPFLDDARAHEALITAARDESVVSRRAATRAIGHTPSSNPRLIGILLGAIDDADAWVRYYAAQALGRLGAEAASRRLTELLRDPAGQVRVAAVEALSHFRNEVALQALREAATSDDPDLRRAALIGLGITGRPDALPALLDALRSPDAATRLVAVSALSGAAGGSEIVPALARAARDPDEAVRSAAIGFLSAAPGASAAAELVELARDMPERERAISALAVQAEGRVPALGAALDRAEEEVAPLLASALARMATPLATEALLQALESDSVVARKAAATALRALGGAPALEAIRRAAKRDPDPAVRQICAILLAD